MKKPSCFGLTFRSISPATFVPLLAHLLEQQARRLVIGGKMTHMCIDATTCAAYDFGFECLIAHDACATKSLIQQGESIPARQVHLAFLASLSGTYAQVLAASEIAALVKA
jgi:nicotinamidase-related amidase